MRVAWPQNVCLYVLPVATNCVLTALFQLLSTTLTFGVVWWIGFPGWKRTFIKRNGANSAHVNTGVLAFLIILIELGEFSFSGHAWNLNYTVQLPSKLAKINIIFLFELNLQLMVIGPLSFGLFPNSDLLHDIALMLCVGDHDKILSIEEIHSKLRYWVWG